MLTLGSLFDGIGGWQLAAQHAGVKPLWSSEIDEYPAEVTKIRFPETKQLGDITKLDGAELPPVDIICAGSPCFTVGASIQTKNGIKPIEKIVVGDMVIADDCEWHKVVEIMRNQAESIYTIKAQGLLELEATGNHPFLVKHMKRYYPTKNGKRCNSRKFSKAEWVKVENLQKGDFVGYSATYRAATNRRIAIVSIGYGDGLPRSLSNIGKVFFNVCGKWNEARIIGRVSMDNVICDITGIDNLQVGDWGYLVFDEYTLDDIARDAGTISYEVLSRLGKNPRFVREILPAK